MSEFAVYIETLNSIADPSKNTRSPKPVGTVESLCRREGESLFDLARRQFPCLPNQRPHVERMPRGKIHAQDDKHFNLTLCARTEFRDYMENFPVNCAACLKILERKNNAK